MAVAQHTPGPWLVEGEDSLNGVPFIPVAGPYDDIPNGRGVAEVSASFDEVRDRFRITDEDRANARLIAAAPDLLAALKDLRTRFHQACAALGTTSEYVALTTPDADAAIARAETA